MSCYTDEAEPIKQYRLTGGGWTLETITPKSEEPQRHYFSGYENDMEIKETYERLMQREQPRKLGEHLPAEPLLGSPSANQLEQEQRRKVVEK